MTIEQTIQKKLHKLPTDKQRKILEFVESLAGEQMPRETPTLRQNWGWALREYGDQYTALRLEKISLEWRRD